MREKNLNLFCGVHSSEETVKRSERNMIYTAVIQDEAVVFTELLELQLVNVCAPLVKKILLILKELLFSESHQFFFSLAHIQ